MLKVNSLTLVKLEKILSNETGDAENILNVRVHKEKQTKLYKNKCNIRIKDNRKQQQHRHGSKTKGGFHASKQ